MLPQAISIFIFIAVYYYELFKAVVVANLLSLPSFWAVTGIFFMISVVSISSLLMAYAPNTNFQTTNIIMTISYSLMFLTYFKTLSCPPKAPN
jgi:hypothetical protein